MVALSTEAPAARETLDVKGLVVAPGFIDLHAHGQDSESYRYYSHDGVTTALELEIGTYPVAPWYAERDGRALINYGVSAGHVGARRALIAHDASLPGVAVIARDTSRRWTHGALPDADLPRLDSLVERGLAVGERSEEHTSELQSQSNLVCRLLLEKKKHNNILTTA